MQIYDNESITLINIDYPDIYFTPEYGKLCQISDSGKWKCIVDSDSKLLIPFIEKHISVGTNKVKHLISNYGYGGFYKDKYYTLDYEKLNTIITDNSYVTHFIRFSPYFLINKISISQYFDKSELTLKGKTYGIDFTKSSYENYLKNTHKNHKRTLKKYADKCVFILRDISSADMEENSNFRKIYQETMDRVNSSKYYYFNNEYFHNLYVLLKSNTLIAEIKFVDTNEIISSAIIFKWKNIYLHYHLGGSKTEDLIYAPNNKLHDGIIKYGFKNNFKLYHLGGGISVDDTLDKYKKAFSNMQFDYYQCKAIYNFKKYDYFINEYNKLNKCANNKNMFPVYVE